MTTDEILHAFRMIAMGRTNAEIVQQLAEKLAAITPTHYEAPGVGPDADQIAIEAAPASEEAPKRGKRKG